MKIFEVLRTIKDHTDTDTMAKLIYDTRQEIIETAGTLKHNKSTREAAIKAYSNNTPDNLAKMQEPENGLYTEGHTAISIPVKGAKYDGEKGIAKMMLDIIKNKKPTDLRDSFDYSIAAAKVNGWRLGDTDHYIMVEGHYYNLSLIARVYNCIADNKTYNGCRLEIQTDAKHPALIMSTQYGIGIVLPFKCPANLTYNVTPGEGLLSAIDKDIDKRIMDGIEAAEIRRQEAARRLHEDDFSDINTEEIKKNLKDAGIENGIVVDPEKLENNSFIQDVTRRAEGAA